jgi:hypothetical protein
VAVADQVNDAIHADVDFIAVQPIQFAIELVYFGLEAFARVEVECIGVPLRELTRQKGKILVPLFMGQTQPF